MLTDHLWLPLNVGNVRQAPVINHSDMVTPNTEGHCTLVQFMLSNNALSIIVPCIAMKYSRLPDAPSAILNYWVHRLVTSLVIMCHMHISLMSMWNQTLYHQLSTYLH